MGARPERGRRRGLRAHSGGQIAHCMPLYACHRCGWATTDSWPRAVPAHASGSPHCPGTIELVAHPAGSRSRPPTRPRAKPAIFLHPAPFYGGSGNAA